MNADRKRDGILDQSLIPFFLGDQFYGYAGYAGTTWSTWSPVGPSLHLTFRVSCIRSTPPMTEPNLACWLLCRSRVQVMRREGPRRRVGMSKRDKSDGHVDPNFILGHHD